jgi:hypothetical protein
MLASSAALELKNNPFAPLGLALAGVMIDPMVDAIVSPSGIVQMISRGQVDGNALKGLGGGEQVPARNGTESHPGSTAQASEGGPVIVHEGYDGYSRYRVVVRATTGTSEDTLGLTLRREGIFTWRLSRVILPQRFFATHTNDTLPNGASHKWLKITDLKGQEIHTKEGVCFFISGRVDNDSTNPGSF